MTCHSIHAVATLRSVDPEVHLICACMAPDHVHAYSGLETCSIRPGRPDGDRSHQRGPGRVLRRIVAEPRVWREVYNVLNRADALLAPGTGLFDDFGLRAHEAPYDMFRWSVLARLTRTRFILVGMGAGPIHRWSNRLLLRVAARSASYASFRDRASLDFMTELGRDTQNDRVVPDIVFASRPAGTEDDSVTPPSTSTGALTVGVDVMGYYGWEAGDPRAEEIHDGYVAKLVHFIRYLLDAGHRVQLLLAQRNDELTIDEVLDARGGTTIARRTSSGNRSPTSSRWDDRRSAISPSSPDTTLSSRRSSPVDRRSRRIRREERPIMARQVSAISVASSDVRGRRPRPAFDRLTPSD